MKRVVLANWPRLALAALCALVSGCGTTKWSDSPRTATEQLLISDAVDRAISEIDFTALADKRVYLDTRYIITVLDQNYVISTLRQHMLASGCIITDKPEDAVFVVEVRTGSLGTNRQDLLFGIPASNLPTVGMLPVGSASIPEIALMKRTKQQGVCKLAVFAYERQSGRPVWQSGNRKVASIAKDTWFMGAGPFQQGRIYDGTAFAGERLDVPLVGSSGGQQNSSVGVPKVFMQDIPQVADQSGLKQVENAGYLSPVPNGSPPPAAAPGAAPAGGATTPAGGPAKPDAAAAPPKAAYTPPLPPPVVPPPPLPPTGPQGNLPPQTVLPPTGNPATSTSGAIQTYNWAKDMLDNKPKQP